MKNLKNLFLIIAIIIYEEILFSYLIFNDTSNIFYKIIFSTILAIFIHLLTSSINIRLGKILRNTIIAIITFVFGAQFVYYQIYKSIISFYSFSNGGQVLQFWKTILDVILCNWNKILLILYPNVITIALHKTKLLNIKKIGRKNILSGFIAMFILQIIALSGMNFSKDSSDIYSTKNLYNKSHVPILMTEKMGIITTMRLDLQRLVTNFNDNSIFAVSSNFEEINQNEITGYNMLNFDWDTIIQNESDETIKSMHQYFSTQQPTSKNSYTGMFEGKNVVVFVAEAFNEVAIDENITPTLYKLYSQGFQFNNFYTPLFPVSTADGEYIADTSLIPKENVWSLSKVSKNYMPYSYANVFENLGYTSQAYHNHSATYYDRDEYIKGMGYDSYLARGTGLEDRMDCSHWPNSDLDMINATIDDYINDEKFVAYYMTVSGHLEYNTGGNYIANKNWDLVKDLPYSDKAKCYMATQIELDKAVEALIKRLEEAGKLDDTVIIISGDHYPYGLTLDELNELSDYKKDDTFEKHRMPLLIWNSGMQESVKVEKIGCSLDIIPTVLNLFGVEYDSRLLMGTDLLSNSESLVIFSNRSFITSKGRYSSLSKKFEGVEVDDGYVDNISKIIYNKYQMSRLILEKDYYRILFDNAVYVEE